MEMLKSIYILHKCGSYMTLNKQQKTLIHENQIFESTKELSK